MAFGHVGFFFNPQQAQEGKARMALPAAFVGLSTARRDISGEFLSL
jgi:hypothetical protein